MSQAPLDAFRPPGDRLVISPSVYIGTTLVPWHGTWVTTERCVPLQNKEGLDLRESGLVNLK